MTSQYYSLWMNYSFNFIGCESVKSYVVIFSQVTQYLLDKTLVMDEDTLYDLSLKIEPRLPPVN